MEPIIVAKDIRRSFRSSKKTEGKGSLLKMLLKPQFETHEALKGVSFTVESGAFIGLIGANGAGKTTLLKIFSGLIPPSSGEARVLGEEPFKRSLGFRKKISLVMGQKAQLWWDLPAIDAFDLLRAIYEIPPKVYKDRIGMLSNLLGVEKLLGTQIRRLSLGERMKMELIGALIHWPKVIFLDEPTIGLDVLAAQNLREFLREFNRREKATIILTSHNMDDIARLCSRVLIMKSGELIYDGSPQRLTREGEKRLRLRLKEQPTIEQIAAATGIHADQIVIGGDDAAAGGDEEGEKQLPAAYLTVNAQTLMPTLQSVLQKFTPIDLGIEEQSLESVIKGLFSGNEVLGVRQTTRAPT